METDAPRVVSGSAVSKIIGLQSTQISEALIG